MLPELTIAQSILLACLGFGVGTLGASVGVGGGFLIVPALLTLFPEASPATITSMSLTAVVMNGISASIGYRRLRWQDTRTGLVLISTAVPMAALGAIATHGINRGSFDLIFGVALILAALYLVIKGSSVPSVPDPSSSGRARTITDARGNIFEYRVREPLAATIAAVAGFVAAFFGIGGGIINVPVMMLVLKMPSPMAVATSQLELVAAAAVAVFINLIMD